MKIKYIRSLAIVGTVLLAASCTENSWNNTFLDDFKGEPTYDNSVSVDYTLTTTDYETIGKALYNMAETAEEKAAANAIQSNHYFDQNSPYPAQVAVPILLNQNQTEFYIYNEGSTVNVSLSQAETPAEITAVNAAPRLILETQPTAASIPSMLLNEYPNAQEGDIAIISYDDASYTSPVVGSAQSERKSIARKAATRAGVDLTSNIKNLTEGATLTATAVVTAQSGRGLILTDNAGSIFYYNNNVDLSTYKIGTIVEVSGSVSVYGTGFQLSNTATMSVVGSETYTYPTPTVYTAAMVDAAAASTTPATAQYVSLTGELSISGNYYNILIDGATAQGSLYTPTEGLLDKLTNGKTYTFTGYFTGVTNGKYFYLVITEVDGDNGSSGGTGGDNNGGGSGGDNEPSGEYWSVSEALSKMANGFTGAAIVEGYVISITELSTSYGNATYVIADDPDDTEGLIVYRGYYLNGEKFTSESQLEVGALVVVSGDLVDYNGTYEFTTGSQILSYNGESEGISFDENKAVNLVYVFDGSSWAVSEDVIALNGADYLSMGLQANNLSNPAVYLPIYLKKAYPYASAGTEIYVAYNLGNNSSKCALMEYDGYNWIYIDNYVQSKVAAFVKSSGSYSFRKYIGEEVFNFYEGDKIALNCSYLIVYGGVCMEPVPTGKSYGYPGETPVTITDGSIVMPNGDNAFTFTTTTEYNGNTYTTPEGYFLIQDANGRYMYLQGTYSSFNVRSNNAYIESDGTISVQYLFKATKEDDGTWRIVNEQEDITRTLYYSDGNNDFAGYTDEQLERYVGRLPYLYISETSTPVADDSESN